MMNEINDWEEVAIDDWVEIPIEPSETRFKQPKQLPSWGEALATGFGGRKILGFGEQMLSGLGNLASYDINKGNEGLTQESVMQANPLDLARDLYGVGSAFGSQLLHRFTNPRETLVNDPSGGYGMLGDISMLTGMGGGVASRIPQLGPAANFMQEVSRYTNPVGIPGNIAKGGRVALGKGTHLGESLMEKGMKIPPGSVKQLVRESITSTMAEKEGLRLGRHTVAKMTDMIKDLDDSVQNTLQYLTNGNLSEINVSDITSALENLKLSYKRRPNPQAIYEVIDKVKQDLLDHSFASGGKITLESAHQLKKGLYEDITEWYQKRLKPETGRVGVQNEFEAVAKDTQARALREAIIKHPDVPDQLKQQLGREAGLMEARKWVERATNRGQNVDPVRLSSLLFGMLVDKGMPVAFAYQVAISQPAMSQLAIWLKRGSQTAEKLGEFTNPVGLGAYQGQRIKQTQQ